MSTASPWEDMEEAFFSCSICLDHFKDPKQLPCLHRYCKGCLTPIVEKHRPNREFKCPLCKIVCDIPAEGVDGFKTDFHSKNIIEYIQLQKSVRNKEVRKCAGCFKEVTATAYCFKCKGFLCDQCYQFHQTSGMLQDHKQHVLALTDIEGKKLTLEKLASLTVAPRCHDHDDKQAEICCGSCDNIPICVVCSTVGKHKGHELYDVKDLARKEREAVTQILDTLEKYEGNVTSLPGRIKKAKSMLKGQVIAEKENLRLQYNKEGTKLQRKMKETDDEIEKQEAEINHRVKKKVDELERQRHMEIQKINIKFDKLISDAKQGHGGESGEKRGMLARNREQTVRKLESLDTKFKDLNKSIELQEKQKSEQFEVISCQSLQRKQRFDNYKSLVSSILGSNDDWMEVRCLYNINRASKPLIEDVKQEFKEIDSMSGIVIGGLRSLFEIKVSEQVEYVIDIRGFKERISGITSTGNDYIIITGPLIYSMSATLISPSHVTVINMKRQVINTTTTEDFSCRGHYSISPSRFCDSLSNSKIATVSELNHIGIYDNEQGKMQISKAIRDIPREWPFGRFVSSLATDPQNITIFVGTNSRFVLVFDDQLIYRHTLTLPAVVKSVMDLTVHDGGLLVCDDKSKKVYIITIKGQNTSLCYEIEKPDFEGRDWYPDSICKDKRLYIYILWGAMTSQSRWKSIVVQYSSDGHQLLTTRLVGASSCTCITTIVSNEGEKLLVAGRDSAKISVFGLV